MTKKQEQNLHVLDGLRGLASIAVILSHCFLMFIPSMHSGQDFTSSWQDLVYNSPFSFFYRGNGAVSLFFVLSGVVLSKACFKNNCSQVYITEAATKRYLRLGIPVGCSIIICYILMHSGIFTASKFGLLNLPLAVAYQESPSIIEAVYDAIAGAMIFGSMKYNYVLWTIGLEFFGSLFVFALLAVFGTKIQVLRLFSFLSSIFLLTNADVFAVYYGLFSFGVLMATYEINYISTIKTKTISILVLLFGLYLIGYAPNSMAYKPLVEWYVNLQNNHDIKIQWPTFSFSIGSIFVIASIFIDYNLYSLLKSRVCRIIGKLSFSIYLLHSFVLAAVGPLIYVYIDKSSMGAFLAFIIVSSITICLAYPFFKYIDSIAIKVSSRVGKILVSEKGHNLAQIGEQREN